MKPTSEILVQIIDDMPTKGHYFEELNIVIKPHPDIEHRLEPSPRASELASKLCQLLDPKTLPLDSKVSECSVLRYADCSKESSLTIPRLWQTAENFQAEMQLLSTSDLSALRLLEITSLAVHNLASNLYQHFHPNPEFYDTKQLFGRIGHGSYIYAVPIEIQR